MYNKNEIIIIITLLGVLYIIVTFGITVDNFKFLLL